MSNKAVENAIKKYNELFSDEKSKAEAFDKIAEQFFYANFGRMSKTDMDVLMFSIYIEQILRKSEDNMMTYSDYTMSKLLGITQSKVSNLKVKKELLYPYDDFDWRKSFERIVSNYRYEDGKIRLFIPDKNLYYELKNVIECSGGYVEVTLNSTLLQVSPTYFVDLLYATMPEKEKQIVKKDFIKTLKEHKIDNTEFEKKSIGDTLKQCGPDIAITIVSELIGDCVPVVGPIIKIALERLREELK